MRSCRCCAGCMAASPACRTWTFWSARLRYCAGFQIQRACIVAVIMSRVYISATLAPTSVLLLGCSTAGAPCLQASCHPPAPHWLRHVSTDQAMLLFKLLTKRVCDLILFSMQVLPGGAAPTARAAAVGALLDELAAAWRRYQHTLDCKRKAAQLSCVPRFQDPFDPFHMCWEEEGRRHIIQEGAGTQELVAMRDLALPRVAASLALLPSNGNAQVLLGMSGSHH